jgi:hypothetical protein
MIAYRVHGRGLVEALTLHGLFGGGQLGADARGDRSR